MIHEYGMDGGSNLYRSLCRTRRGDHNCFCNFWSQRYKEEKFGPYECGVDPIGSARERFSVHFYLVAILFILFDIEMVFLIPWAVLYRKLGIFGLVEAGIFLAVLGFGLAYVWRKKALKWD